MKDLIAKLQIDANCALGAIWLHIDAQAARIAELEAQQAFGIGETYANALSRIAELEAQIAAAPVPVVEEKDLWALLPNSAWYLDPPDGGNVSLLEQLQRMSKDAASYRSTALQAPVREVPGYKLVPIDPSADMLIAGGELYFDTAKSWKRGSTTRDQDAAGFVYRAMINAAPLPAAPVQEPKP